jgi:hypothetical protein
MVAEVVGIEDMDPDYPTKVVESIGRARGEWGRSDSLARSSGEGEGEGRLRGAIVWCGAHSVPNITSPVISRERMPLSP